MFIVKLHKNEKPVFSNCSGSKSVFEKLRFCEGLVGAVLGNRHTEP